MGAEPVSSTTLRLSILGTPTRTAGFIVEEAEPLSHEGDVTLASEHTDRVERALGFKERAAELMGAGSNRPLRFNTLTIANA